ncbi:unnamed protein product [Pipistrellus nathusii]|uniref:Uncharacterized protein n=1 Tax=Pipistrellus nathusii TaxID=59473 RepID=A0ABP0A7P2_PIPNA
MVPARPNVPAAGTPRSKVKYSALPSSEGGRMDPQEKTPQAEGCCPSQRCPGAAGPRWMELQESPAKTPYRALACFTLQFLVGAFLATAGCLSPVGPRRARGRADRGHPGAAARVLPPALRLQSEEAARATPSRTFPTAGTSGAGIHGEGLRSSLILQLLAERWPDFVNPYPECSLNLQ